jgi:hypothetical protein
MVGVKPVADCMYVALGGVVARRSSLKQLKSKATVRSVGTSTRIEVIGMSDKEFEHLLRKRLKK